MKKRDELYAIEDELESMKAKSVVSYALYANLKNLFANTESIIEPQNALNYFITSRYAGHYKNTNQTEKNPIFSQISKTNNFQMKELYRQYYSLLTYSFSMQLFSSLIYILPFILIKVFGNRFKMKIQSTASNFIANISTTNNNYLYAHC